MASLKDTLGDLYTAEIAEKLKSAKFVDLNDGEYVSKAKRDSEVETARATAAAAAEGKYKADAEEWQKYKGEIEGLRKFKTDTEAAALKDKQDKAFLEMAKKNNIKEAFAKRELARLDRSTFTLDDKGAVNSDYEKAYVKALSEEFPEAIEQVQPGSGVPAQGDYGQKAKTVGSSDFSEWATAINARQKN